MKNVMTIIKKELSRFFKDKKTLFSLILPGLLIFIIYSVMGSAISNQVNSSEAQTYIIHAINTPEKFQNMLADTIELEEVEEQDLEKYKTDVYENNIEIIVVFETDFETKFSSNANPKVDIIFNPNSDTATTSFNIVNAYLEQYKNILVEEIKGTLPTFQVNIMEHYDPTQTTGLIMSMLLPFLIIVFLFAGAMGIAPESIAGEKERGTIATLLVTPVKRSHIALGKITSLSVVATVSALSSFIGIILSIPKLMAADASLIDASVYKISDYLIIFLLLIVTVLLITAILSNISGLAKDVKTATAYITPLYMVVCCAGIFTMFGGSQSSNFVYLIPIYNTINILASVFAFEFSFVPFIITIISNLVYTAIFIYLLTRMFNSEKIMFSK